MNQRAQYLIQILDKIGAPLLGAAESSSDDTETAQIVASLLGKVVETSISMNQALDLNATDAQDDSLRVALAALAGSLVADQYMQKGKIPEAGDLNRIQAAMSAVLTFGDNFTLSDDHITRLEKLKADGGVVDAHQINIQYVDALIPVINAVGAFPFGQPEQKLIMDVSDRLVKRTAEMRETLMPSLSGDDEKLAELAILRAVANVYAACHKAETQRLASSDADGADAVSIDPVWQAFEMRTAMLESVVKNMIPDSAANATPTPPAPPVESGSPIAPIATPTDTAAPDSVTGQAGAPADIAKPAIFQTKPNEDNAEQAETPPPIQEPTAPPPPAPPPAQESPVDQNGGGNPMAFFGSKKPDNSAEDTPAPPPPPQEPPATVPPPAPPQEPPAAQPLPAPPSQEEEGDSSDDGGNGAGNPMSFFGKKD